jgi:hypothetical protein
MKNKYPVDLKAEKAKLTPKSNESIIKKSPASDVQPKSVQVSEGSFKNAFGEIVKNPNPNKG